MEDILQVKGIVKTFPGTKALDSVTFSVRRGEVHALVGENGAGKSTLMNIVGGIFHADEGEVLFDGEAVDFDSPLEAQDAGVGFVHQELALCSHLTVGENIFMGTLSGFLDYKKIFRDADAILSQFTPSFRASDIVSSLSISEQQVIEIAKAMSHDCKLLILDEPTSSLSQQETEILFDIVCKLRDKGISILYISHRLAEIFRICDRATVFRDGKFISTVDIADSSAEEIVRLMVGREIGDLYPEKAKQIGETILKVEGLSIAHLCRDLSFALRRNEILGFFGLIGAGRSEIMRAICGIDKKESGRVTLLGKDVDFTKYEDSIDSGLSYLTEDRKVEGLFLKMSIKSNIVASSMEKVSRRLFVDGKRETSVAGEMARALNVKASGLDQLAESLSGGNQQKVMIAKWLAVKPKVLILDEPTRGIDVGAKREIHRLLRELAEQGIGVIMISSELPEIIGVSDRIIVMHEGKITGELDNNSAQVTEEEIMILASGQGIPQIVNYPLSICGPEERTP